MLEKVQLLVGGFDREVFAFWSLIGAFCSKWWIRQHNIIATTTRHFVNRISQSNLRLEAVKIQIHQREATRTLNQILSEVRRTLEPFRQLAINCSAFRLLDQPFVSTDKKAAGTARWISDRKVFMSAWIRFRDANNRLNQNARREVLARPLLSFARSLLQQTFKSLSLHINVQAGPLGFVDKRDHAFEINGIVEA